MIRSFVNKHSTVMTIVVLVILAMALGYLLYSREPESGGVPDAYFYDTGSTAADPLDRLYALKGNDVPPIAAPSNTGSDRAPAGVRARVYSCGDCRDRASLYIGFVETNSPRAKDAISAMQKAGEQAKGSLPGLMAAIDEGNTIAVLPDLKWVRKRSQEGLKILADAQQHCGAGVEPIECQPGMVK
jgi:hypothetical protein